MAVTSVFCLPNAKVNAEDFSQTEFEGTFTVEKKAPGVSVVHISGLSDGQVAAITGKSNYEDKVYMEMEYREILRRGADSRFTLEEFNQFFEKTGGTFTDSVEVRADKVTSMETAFVCIYEKQADGITYKQVQIAMVDIPYMLDEAKIYYDFQEITDVNQLSSGERYLLLPETYGDNEAVASIPKYGALIHFAGTNPNTAEFATIYRLLPEKENQKVAHDVNSLWNSTRLLYTPQAAISFLQTGTEFGGAGHGLMGYYQGTILRGTGWYSSYSSDAINDNNGPLHLYSYKTIPLTEDLVTVTYNNSTLAVVNPGAVTLDISDFKAVADINGVEYEIPYLEFAAGDDSIDPAIGDTTVKISLGNLSYEVPVPVMGKYICGKVVDKEGNILTNIKAELKQDGVVLQTVMTDKSGVYTFTDVDAGKYQVVVTYEDSQRKLSVVKSDRILTNDTIKFGPGDKKTSLEIDANVPKTVIENLDRIYNTIVTDDNKGFTQANHDVIEDGGDAEVIVSLKRLTNTAEHAEYIQNLADKQITVIGMYLDISVEKAVTEVTENRTETNLIELPQTITLKMELEETLQNKGTLVVYRYHQGYIDVITSTPNADGESVTVSDDGKTVIINIKKFSTYALGYSNEAITVLPASIGVKDLIKEDTTTTETTTAADTVAASTSDGTAETASMTTAETASAAAVTGSKKPETAPKTGDTAPVASVILMLFTAAGLAGVALRKKK